MALETVSAYVCDTAERGSKAHVTLYREVLRRLQSDRGECYASVRAALSDVASFSLPEDGVHYDALLIVRGCTGCPYLYEEIDAAHRIVITSKDETQSAIDEIRAIASSAAR